MSLLVILYVWQNIEIVQIEMQYRSLSEKQGRLVKENDRLLYEIERYRRMDVIDDFARNSGMRRMLPGDFDILVVNEKHGK